GGEDYRKQYEVIKREEEQTSKAPEELPFSLQTVVQDLGNVFISLMNIRARFDNAKQTAPKVKIAKIESLQEDIDNINKQIFDLTNALHTIKLGND
ncbi:hypothetical protein EBU95_20280, partial [bacterium]|nr:hypothetical protein [bacterium]